MENIETEALETRKLRGGYYTPPEIADFICKWAITDINQQVLEPSCGDGNFIESAIKRFLDLGLPSSGLFGHIQGVELQAAEAEKSKFRAASFGLNSTTIMQSDFFQYLSKNQGRKFDVVVGNPPFIRYQNFPEEHRSVAFDMMERMGLHPNKLTNIWVPFLVLSAGVLNENGKLGMVIPAELFQVKYATETRVFLSRFFERITIVTFKKLVFTDIQQEVVLLLCEKIVQENPGIRVVELDTLKSLEYLNISNIHSADVKELAHDTEKWTKYFLDQDEIDLLRKAKTNNQVELAGAAMITNVGLVTGLNEFFMVNEETAKHWNILPYTKKVVSRSAHFKGLYFSDTDFKSNSDAGYDGYLFLPPDVDFNELPEACQKYVAYGESKKFHTGYKCKIRKRWYITPSIYSPDAFALRQVGAFPKIILNYTKASSTDTIHRVRFKPDINPELVAASFMNSLTFAFSEITGRSYGGGVLTFEPTEIGELPLPILNKSVIDLQKIDLLIREKEIDKVLDIVDKELLVNQLGFEQSDVAAFRNIWKKLSGRRLNRK